MMGHASLSIGSKSLRERRWSHAARVAPDRIADILERFTALAIVGLSSKPTRPSHGVAAYMKDRGYRIIPVNPNEKSVFGEKTYESLEQVPDPIEIVVIFRRPEYVPEIVETAIRRGAKVIWMQEGVVHEDAARRARQAGLEVIQDRCILKEYAKRFVVGAS
jgi:predicted CoA-binding protein